MANAPKQNNLKLNYLTSQQKIGDTQCANNYFQMKENL